MAKSVNLRKLDTGDTAGYAGKEDALAAMAPLKEEIAALQGRLLLDGTKSLLVVVQGTDASGKDGTARAIVSAVNPMGVQMTGFKRPSPDELAHDFLWRIHRAVPGRGQIGIFNRSHYEDIVAVRVEKIAPKEVWKPRYAAVNDFERNLAREGTTIVKLLLTISKDEQLQRLEARRTDPVKRWKWSTGDVERRARWDDYLRAYDDVLAETSTDWAPWHVVPADHKWARDIQVLTIVANAMRSMNLPEVTIPADEPSLLTTPAK